MAVLKKNNKIKALGGTLLAAVALSSGFIYFTQREVVIAKLPEPYVLFASSSKAEGPMPSPFAGSAGVLVLPGQVPAFPLPPSVPSMPGAIGQNGSAFTVVGVLPPNIAIVKEGSSIKTVKVGDKLTLGQIEGISKDGITVSGQFYALKTGGKENGKF